MKNILLIITSFVLSASSYAEKLPTSIEAFLSKRPEYKKLSDEREIEYAEYYIDSAYFKEGGHSSVIVLVRGEKIVGYLVIAYGAFTKDELLPILRNYYTEEQFDVKNGGSVSGTNGRLPSNAFFFIDKEIYPLAKKEHQDEVIKRIIP